MRRNIRSRWAQRGLCSFVVHFTLGVLFCPAALHAQVAGTISGYVQDQAGGMMPGATVTAESTGQQLVRSTHTNTTGFFDLQALPRGTYLVKVEIAGFKTQIQKDIEVTAGANVRLDFVLGLGDLAEEVVVSGQRDDGGDAERDAIESDRRPAGAGPAHERPQRGGAGRDLRRRHRRSARTRIRPTGARGRSCR